MVSEKKIRQMAENIKETISDEKMFSSPVLQQYLQELADIVIKKEVDSYNRIHDKALNKFTDISVQPVYEPRNETVAFAASLSRRGVRNERTKIIINAGNQMFEEVKDRVQHLLYVKGLLAHECAHVIYTDFRLDERETNKILSNGEFDLITKDLVSIDEMFRENYQDILEYLKVQENRSPFVSVARNIDNIAEDGFIEQTFIERNKGSLAEGLYELRWFHYKSIPKVKESLNPSTIEALMSGCMDNPLYQALMQAYLCYAKYRTVKADVSDSEEKQVVDILETCRTELDMALASMDAGERKRHVNNTIVILWKYIKDYIESVKQAPKSAGGSGGSGSESGSGSGSGDVSERINKDHESLKGNSAIDEEMQSGGIYKPQPKDKEELDDAPPDTENEKEEKGAEEKNANGKKPKGDADSEEGEPDDKEGDIIRNNDYIPDEDAHDSAADILDNILSEIARDEAEIEAEKERLKEMNKDATQTDLGDASSGINIKVNRMAYVPPSLYDEYDNISPPLLAISKILQKRVSQKLKDRRRGGKQTGLYFGRKLDARTLIRKDGRYFYKNKLPQKDPELCVAVLLDESGSMYRNNRYTYTRATGLILYDFCTALGIPVAVYGHDEDGLVATINMYSYAEFESIDKKDRYRIMDVQARANNRDGAALRYMYEMLAKRPEPKKLLFIISDGAPNASGYVGIKAERDIKDAVSKAKSNNIVTIAAAIGEDKEDIMEIYGKDSFLDITNLDALPVIITEHVIRALKL